jgi:hypothetical protein
VVIDGLRFQVLRADSRRVYTLLVDKAKADRVIAALRLCRGAATVLAFAPVGVYPLALVTLRALVHRWSERRRASVLAGLLVRPRALPRRRVVGLREPERVRRHAAAARGLRDVVFCAFSRSSPRRGLAAGAHPALARVRAACSSRRRGRCFEWLRGGSSPAFRGSPSATRRRLAAAGLRAARRRLRLSFVTVRSPACAGCVSRRKQRCRRRGFVACVGAAKRCATSNGRRRGRAGRARAAAGQRAQEMKFRPERYAKILETYARLAESERAKLIVLPETAVPRLLDQVEPAYLARSPASRAQRRRPAARRRLREPRDAYYNSVSRSALAAQIYHKRTSCRSASSCRRASAG